MTLPGNEPHSATLAGVLAGQLLALSQERDERAISECMYRARLLVVMELAYELGVTGFVLRLLEPRRADA